ncbi:MAG TPA: ribonuclease H-like domain-containing protein [Turneriella sp.]|nr:ribonuclease H-like domain-containing protein [Turneriella sp.]
MGLEERLRAYNAVRPSINKPTGNEKKNSNVIETFYFDTHPVSGETLALPPKIAVDFRLDIHRENFLFFDLESTGLGSGEQVYPFLIGLADSQKSGAQLTTLFADTPADEEEILIQFLNAARGKTLVSFNGKSFDLPLILRRAEKYGIDARGLEKQHVDLYHLIRRIFPEKPSRLIDAETRLLHFTRKDDLSGAAVAQAYFEMLQFKNDALKNKIIDHNKWDVLSLLSLLLRVSVAFTHARRGEHLWAYKIHRDKSATHDEKKQLLIHAPHTLDARDFYTLGQVYRREKDYHKAARAFLTSYRQGYANAAIDTVRALARLKKTTLAHSVARYALRHEDERVQRHLMKYA